MAQRISTVAGVAQVQVYGAQKYAVRIQLDPRAARHARRRHRRSGQPPSAPATSTSPPASSPARITQLHRAGERAALQGRRLPRRSSSPTATARPSASTSSARSSTTSRTTRPRPGSAASAASSWPCRSSRERTPSKSPTASARCCRRSASQLPAVGRPADPSRPRRVDPRLGRRREVHAAAHALPGHPGDLPLPAEHLRDDHPQPGAADVDRRHVRRDVPLRLLARQPLADGAHALGRLRRRRRHRHAGEHRPAHGDGREAVRGGAEGLEGDRLHDHLDDDLAGRGLHPHPLHGRHPRAALPRIRGHDRRGHPRLRLRLALAHAAALARSSSARTARSSTAGCTRPSSGSSTACSRFYERGLRFALRHRATTLVFSLVVLAATVWLFIAVPKGFIPNEDQSEIRISLEAAQGISFPELVRHQRVAMDIVAKDPRVATFFSFVGRGGGSEQPASSRCASCRRRQRKDVDRQGHRRPPSEAERHSRPARLAPESAAHPPRRTAVELAVPVHAAVGRHGRCSTTPSQKMMREDAHAARIHRREDRRCCATRR